MRIPVLGAASALLLLLGGCGGDPDPVLAQGFGFVCSNHDNPGTDVLCKNRPAGKTGEVVSRYCYETIGDANCFDTPDVMSRNQELGSSGN
jgi:hypothetical protein